MSKNKKFEKDYYRMTGTKYCLSLNTLKNIVFMHNLRYMWWWRNESKALSFLRKVQLYRYSRKYGLEIGNAQIGEGLYLGHPYNITVNGQAKIGNNVNLHKGVTIGAENRGKRKGAPQIGNNVFVGVNSTIVGNITIGDDVLIAPNSFVNFDVPSHSVVIGNPATVHEKSDATAVYVCFRE